jgi:hypothetical protein
MSAQATNPQADHVGDRADWQTPQGGTRGDRPPRRRTQAVDSHGLRAPADAAAPAAQQHVRTLGPGRAGHPYDERLLSNTKLSCMYTPGAGPVTFEVDGLRLGCAMGHRGTLPRAIRRVRASTSTTRRDPSRPPGPLPGHAVTCGCRLSAASLRWDPTARTRCRRRYARSRTCRR